MELRNDRVEFISKATARIVQRRKAIDTYEHFQEQIIIIKSFMHECGFKFKGMIYHAALMRVGDFGKASKSVTGQFYQDVLFKRKACYQ